LLISFFGSILVLWIFPRWHHIRALYLV
jgi:hypothetical protein